MTVKVMEADTISFTTDEEGRVVEASGENASTGDPKEREQEKVKQTFTERETNLDEIEAKEEADAAEKKDSKKEDEETPEGSPKDAKEIVADPSEAKKDETPAKAAEVKPADKVETKPIKTDKEINQEAVNNRIGTIVRKTNDALRGKDSEIEALKAENESLKATKPGDKPDTEESGKGDAWADSNDLRPKLDEFKDYDEFKEAYDRWVMRDESRKIKHADKVETDKESENKKNDEAQVANEVLISSGIEKYGDKFKEAMEVTYTPEMGAAILDAPNAIDLIFQLSQSPDIKEKIAALSSVKQIQQIGFISEQLKNTNNPKLKSGKAQYVPPKPLNIVVGDGAKGTKKLTDMIVGADEEITDEFVAAMDLLEDGDNSTY